MSVRDYAAVTVLTVVCLVLADPQERRGGDVAGTASAAVGALCLDEGIDFAAATIASPPRLRGRAAPHGPFVSDAVDDPVSAASAVEDDHDFATGSSFDEESWADGHAAPDHVLLRSLDPPLPVAVTVDAQIDDSAARVVSVCP